MNVFERLPMEPPTEKSQVVISRYWNNPEITVFVNREKIELTTDLDKFIDSLLIEMNERKIIIRTKKGFEKKLKDTVKKVLLKVQESTNQVMAG